MDARPICGGDMIKVTIERTTYEFPQVEAGTPNIEGAWVLRRN